MLEEVGDFLEDGVSDGVSEAIVDFFEVIDVDEEDGEGLFVGVAVHFLEGEGELCFELSAIEDGGEGVAGGGGEELLDLAGLSS